MEDADVLVQAMAGSPEKNTPLDFSQVTPSKFGISTESFIPSSRNKGESVAQSFDMARNARLLV